MFKKTAELRKLYRQVDDDGLTGMTRSVVITTFPFTLSHCLIAMMTLLSYTYYGRVVVCVSYRLD